jgi:hypothetical protein
VTRRPFISSSLRMFNVLPPARRHLIPVSVGVVPSSPQRHSSLKATIGVPALRRRAGLALISSGMNQEEPSDDASNRRTAPQGARKEDLPSGIAERPQEAALRRPCQSGDHGVCGAACARWTGLLRRNRQWHDGTHAIERRSSPSRKNIHHAHCLMRPIANFRFQSKDRSERFR